MDIEHYNAKGIDYMIYHYLLLPNFSAFHCMAILFQAANFHFATKPQFQISFFSFNYKFRNSKT